MKRLPLILLMAREIFPWFLLFYLFLFLLEYFLPGFVSNNFNLNWLLLAVLFTGVLAVLASDKQPKEETPTKNDYILLIFLSLLGSVLFFVKLDIQGFARWLTAGAGGLLIAFTEFTLLATDDDEKIVQQRNIPQPLLLKRFHFQPVYILPFALVILFLAAKNTGLFLNKPGKQIIEKKVSQKQILPPQVFFWDDFNDPNLIKPLKNLKITVLNGGGEKGAAASFSALLRQNGYEFITSSDASKNNYENAVISFGPEDKAQASVIKNLLRLSYPLILEVPAEASSSGITVILGEKNEAF